MGRNELLLCTGRNYEVKFGRQEINVKITFKWCRKITDTNDEEEAYIMSVLEENKRLMQIQMVWEDIYR